MSKFKLSKLFTPKVLSGVAMVGVVATAILGAADGMRAKPHIDKAFAEYPEDREKSLLKVSTYMVPRVGGYFIKTAIVAGGTITLIVVSGYLSGIQLAAMAGTVSYAVANRDKLEKELEKFPGGKDAVKRVKKEMAKVNVEGKIKEEKERKYRRLCKFSSIEDSGNGEQLFVDTYSGRVFRSNIDAVLDGLCQFNDERDQGLPFGEEYTAAMAYNDLYDKLNLEHTHFGYMVGYRPVRKDDQEARRIEFEVTLVKLEDMIATRSNIYGEDVYMISIANGMYPQTDWNEYDCT